MLSMFSPGWIFALVLPLGIFACGTVIAVGIIISRGLRTRREMLLLKESRQQHPHHLSPLDFEDVYKKPRTTRFGGIKMGGTSIRAIPYHETASALAPKTGMLAPVHEVSPAKLPKPRSGILNLGAPKPRYSDHEPSSDKKQKKLNQNNNAARRTNLFRKLNPFASSASNANQARPRPRPRQRTNDSFPRLSVQIRHSITSSLMNEINMAFDNNGYINNGPNNIRENVHTPESRIIQSSPYKSLAESRDTVTADLGTPTTGETDSAVAYRGTIHLHPYGTKENSIKQQSYFPPDLEKLVAAVTRLDRDDTILVPPDKSPKRNSQLSSRRLSPPLPIKSKAESIESDIPTRSSTTNMSRYDSVDVYRVVHSYQPAMDDELELRSGEKLVVYQMFKDGWCYAKLLTNMPQRITSMDRALEGVCPTSCLAAL